MPLDGVLSKQLSEPRPRGRPRKIRRQTPCGIPFWDVVEGLRAIPPTALTAARKAAARSLNADPDLTDNDKRLGCRLIWKTRPDRGYSFETLSSHADKLGVSERTAERCLQRLIQAGHMGRQAVPQPGTYAWWQTAPVCVLEAFMRLPMEPTGKSKIAPADPTINSIGPDKQSIECRPTKSLACGLATTAAGAPAARDFRNAVTKKHEEALRRLLMGRALNPEPVLDHLELLVDKAIADGTDKAAVRAGVLELITALKRNRPIKHVVGFATKAFCDGVAAHIRSIKLECEREAAGRAHTAEAAAVANAPSEARPPTSGRHRGAIPAIVVINGVRRFNIEARLTIGWIGSEEVCTVFANELLDQIQEATCEDIRRAMRAVREQLVKRDRDGKFLRAPESIKQVNAAIEGHVRLAVAYREHGRPENHAGEPSTAVNAWFALPQSVIESCVRDYPNAKIDLAIDAADTFARKQRHRYGVDLHAATVQVFRANMASQQERHDEEARRERERSEDRAAVLQAEADVAAELKRREDEKRAVMGTRRRRPPRLQRLSQRRWAGLNACSPGAPICCRAPLPTLRCAQRWPIPARLMMNVMH